jgi:threonine dehydrogenase-like Zn-dependent dehydrogenase
MKSAILNGPMDLSVEDVEAPEDVDETTAIIKVKACGICGTDLHMYKLGLFTDEYCRITEKGPAPGHEFCGEVVKVHEDTVDLNVGDRVTAVLFGAMAEYVSVITLPELLFKLPPEVGDEEAATLEPLANSLHAARKGNPRDGENVVIFGAGIIGLGIVQCLKAMEMNLNKIIVVDFSEHRLNVAKDLGADEVINAAVDDPFEKIIQIVGEDSALFKPDLVCGQVDIIYDCVGYMKDRPGVPVIQQAINLMRDLTGRIVVHGMFEDNVSLDLYPFLLKQTAIYGSYGFEHEDMTDSIKYLRSKKINRSQLISHKFSLENVKEAFDVQCRTEESVKVIVIP